MLDEMLMGSPETCQVADAVRIGHIFGYSNFTRWCSKMDGNLCAIYIENFLTNQMVKEF